MKFSIKDFFSTKGTLLEKSLMENFIFCAVNFTWYYLQIMYCDSNTRIHKLLISATTVSLLQTHF